MITKLLLLTLLFELLTTILPLPIRFLLSILILGILIFFTPICLRILFGQTPDQHLNAEIREVVELPAFMTTPLRGDERGGLEEKEEDDKDTLVNDGNDGDNGDTNGNGSHTIYPNLNPNPNRNPDPNLNLNHNDFSTNGNTNTNTATSTPHPPPTNALPISPHSINQPTTTPQTSQPSTIILKHISRPYSLLKAAFEEEAAQARARAQASGGGGVQDVDTNADNAGRVVRGGEDERKEGWRGVMRELGIGGGRNRRRSSVEGVFGMEKEEEQGEGKDNGAENENGGGEKEGEENWVEL